MPRSLHVRLALVFLVLLVLGGSYLVATTLATTRLYFEEATQNLNRDLANNIASMKHDLLLTDEGELRAEGLEELFHWLMVVNPDLEFYLLKRDGQILAFDAPPGVVVRDRIDLASVHEFLAADDGTLIYGDDPRGLSRQKIFSVSPLPPTGEPRGYLYIVLASQQLEGALDRLQSSYILRLATWKMLAFLVLTALFGILVFTRLTRPLRRLAERMRSSFRAAEDLPPAAAGGEVALLETTFEKMTERIGGQMAEIERMTNLRRELIANVSHDLRTPLATLQGYLETLTLKDGALKRQEHDEYLQIALKQSERLGHLIAELFELTKLENDDVVLQKEPFSLAELIHDNVQRFQLAAAAKGVELRVEIEAERPFVEADIGLIERALENLISNAVRFTPDRGLVTIRLRQDQDRVEVEVTDTGCGISADEIPHIFDRYYRGRFNQAAADAQGAGLGLAITKRILELHKSSIQVSSLLGRGTTFSFSLGVFPS